MRDLVVIILASTKTTDEICSVISSKIKSGSFINKEYKKNKQGDINWIQNLVSISNKLDPHEIIVIVSKNNIKTVNDNIQSGDVRLKIQSRNLEQPMQC